MERGIVDVCGGESHFPDSVRQALELAEVEDREDREEVGVRGGEERYRDEVS